MINSENTQAIQVIQPIAKLHNQTVTSAVIDLAGFDRAVFYLQVGSESNAALAAAKLTECSTSGGSYADVPAFTVGNAACLDIEGSAIALAATAASDAVVFQVDCTKRERFLKYVVTTGASDTAVDVFGVLAILSRRTESGADTNASFITPSTGTALVSRA